MANPAANRGGNRALLEQLKQRVSATDHAEWEETNRSQHAMALARDAAARGIGVVVAVGGDGTVHETVNGLLRVHAEARPALAVVPVGTGNDFAMGAGVYDSNPHAVTERILAASGRRNLDAAVVRDEHGRAEYWVNTLGIGFDAAANLQARRKTRLRGFPLYLLAVLRTVARNFHASQVELDLDGAKTSVTAMMFSVGNGSREGGGFLVTPAAKMDDGWLDYAMVAQLSRLQMLLLLPKVMNGTHPASPHVSMGMFRMLHMRMRRALPVHADGEIFSLDQAHELTVEVLPGALTMLI